MRAIACFSFILFSISLFAQSSDLSSLLISNLKTSTNAKGLQIKFDYQYLNSFPDSLNFAVIARLKTADQREVVISKPIYLTKRTKTPKEGDRMITIPFRTIELNEGDYQLNVELEAYHQEGNNFLLSATTTYLQQPKRYVIEVEVSKGIVSILNSRGQSWDSTPLFSRKKEKRLPDPQWWIYIESTYLNTPSSASKDSFSAPSANFRIIVLHSEKVYIKLYDEDGFINKDDLIGTFRILHPHTAMQESLLNQTAENVTGFNVNMRKYQLILGE